MLDKSSESGGFGGRCSHRTPVLTQSHRTPVLTQYHRISVLTQSRRTPVLTQPPRNSVNMKKLIVEL